MSLFFLSCRLVAQLLLDSCWSGPANVMLLLPRFPWPFQAFIVILCSILGYSSVIWLDPMWVQAFRTCKLKLRATRRSIKSHNKYANALWPHCHGRTRVVIGRSYNTVHNHAEYFVGVFLCGCGGGHARQLCSIYPDFTQCSTVSSAASRGATICSLCRILCSSCSIFCSMWSFYFCFWSLKIKRC